MSLNFGQALEAINDNKRVRRSGWNGKGMWVGKMWSVPVVVCGHRAYTEPCIAMYTAEGKLQPGWLASQMDLLATDWEIL